MRLEPLTALAAHHTVEHFDCTEDSLNRYLHAEALPAQESGVARTHVRTVAGGTAVGAYFTIVPTMVQPTELPRPLRVGKDRPIPGYLLAKLALDRPFMRHGLGTDLILDALTVIVRAADAAGGRVIVVDSLQDNKVHGFYCRADFTPIDGTYRLWMKLSTAREALDGLGDVTQGHLEAK